jgi:hypothetical protein
MIPTARTIAASATAGEGNRGVLEGEEHSCEGDGRAADHANHAQGWAGSVGGEKRFAERASGPDHALALYALQARS